jgi:predicted ATPase
MLRVDALNEVAYVNLMRLYGLQGDRAKALQVYHQCMTVLREELGVDPSVATRKLYEQLLMEEDTPQNVGTISHSGLSVPSLLPPSRSLAESFPLVGRESEWQYLQQWAGKILHRESSASSWNKFASETSHVLLLLGEPGIGKTRLLEELQAFAQKNRARVIWGQSFAAEIMRPYGIWIDALRSVVLAGASEPIAATVNLPTELGFLLPELGQPSQAPPDLSHLFDAVVRLLMQWASQAPLLILLDDIQWIDEASTALLHYAMRLLRSAPVLFALAARAGELVDNVAMTRVIQALRREQRLQAVELMPLDREQIAALMRRIDTKPIGLSATNRSELSLAVVDRVFADSGGNPLFALEIARSLGHSQTARVNTVEALIQDRLRQLDEPTREVLPWAAALGRSFKPSTLAHVAEYPMTKLLPAIEQLEQQGIIRPGQSLEAEMGYDFAHEVVRRAVYQQLSEPRRQLLHRQIAYKLDLQAGSDNSLASNIVHHAVLGGDRALAVAAALAAAERGLKLFAYTEASELAQEGIRACQFLDPQNRILSHAQLLRVCALAGASGDRFTDMENEVHCLIDEAKTLDLNEAESILLATLVILNFNRGNFTAVYQHALEVAEASRFNSPIVSAPMLAGSGSCLAEIGRDMARAEALLIEAQSQAARVGLELGDIHTGWGIMHRHYGRYAEARSQLQQSLRLVRAEQDHWRECTYLSYLAMTELESGDPLAALPYCDRILVVAAKIKGEESESATAKALAALVRYRLQHPDAAAELNQAIATLQKVDAKRILAYVLIGAAEIDLQSDRLELAVHRAEFALKNAQIVNHPSEIALAWAALVQGLLGLGEIERAKVQFETGYPTLERENLSLSAQAAVDLVLHHMQNCNTG